tara:strand:+ start:206 stop:430 length:225 start_codon:yes stop_codon:yes gene_type:complete|eukprot:scaffold77478_cov51-Phaeocystis_antarctica.AAC.1
MRACHKGASSALRRRRQTIGWLRDSRLVASRLAPPLLQHYVERPGEAAASDGERAAHPAGEQGGMLLVRSVFEE